MDEVVAGEDRLCAVSALTAAWDGACSGANARLVVIKGGSGTGRSIMLRVFYRHFAMRQLSHYWPRDLTVQSVSYGQDRPSRVAERDVIFPQRVEPAEDSRLEFFWWALRARPGAIAALEGKPQVDAHLEELKSAVERASKQVHTRLWTALDAGLLIGSLLPLGGTLAALVDIAGGARTAPELVRRAGQALRREGSIVDAGHRANAGRVLDLGAPSAGVSAARAEARALALIAGLIPHAIVVDDAEHLDAVTIELLKGILRNGETRGLICLTINTDHPTAQYDKDQAVLEHWLDEEDRLGRLQTITLQPLTTQELTDAALHELGGAQEGAVDTVALAEVIAVAQGSPGRLMNLLDLPAVRTAVTMRGELPEDLGKLSREETYNKAWLDLPAQARIALAAASLHGQSTVAHWLTSLNTPAPAPVTPEGLASAISTGWVTVDTSGFLRFRSPRLYNVAHRHVAEELTPDQCHRVALSLIDHIRGARGTDEWVEMPAAVRESVLESVADMLGVQEVDSSWVAELLRLRRVTGRKAASEEALEALEQRVLAGTAVGPLVTATAEALFDAGHAQRALNMLTAELRRLADKYGHGSAATLPALHNLAAMWAARAQERRGHPDGRPLLDQAVALYDELIELRMRHHSPSHPRIPETRRDLAHLLADAFRYRHTGGAIAQMELCLAEMKACSEYGADHPDTLGVRNNLAHLTGEAGDAAGARDLYAALLPDAEMVLGRDHPHTFGVRKNFAQWTGEAGDAPGARDLYAALLPDAEMVLGPDHPDTFGARNNLAQWTGEAGDAAGARDLYAALLPDQTQLLGPDHPATLATRNNLAAWTGEAGDTAKARDLLGALLPDLKRAFGPDDPHTLLAPSNLAKWTGEAGDPDGARVLFAELLPDLNRVLGPDHPHTMAARSTLIFWTAKAGRMAAARNLCAALLVDQTRLLGPDHPHTVTTRNNLARLSGDLDGEATPPALDE